MRAATSMQDAYGPEYTITIKDPATNLTGFLVIHNTALGPGKGGIRMSANVSAEEVYRLAETMTWKNALAGIPFGGAKAGIQWSGDPHNPADTAKKKSLMQSFARALKPLMPKKYIAGPDVNTGEREMQWFVEATGNWRTATGKPANYCMLVMGKEGEKCGIPHEFGSTGFGVAHATKVAAEYAGIDLRGATVAIHGFGNVGTFAYQYLTEMGAKVIALADASGAVWDREGFDPKRMKQVIAKKTLLRNAYPKKVIAPDEFWRVPVDILIPASVTDVIHEKNKDGIKARVIVEAGNIPMQLPIEDELSGRGILIVPDFVANAGGVISSYAEYRGYNPSQMFKLVERKIVKATHDVLSRATREKRVPRAVGMEIARERVEIAMKKRGSTFK